MAIPDNTIYNKSIRQSPLFPQNNHHIVNHNVNLLEQYYTLRQYKHFEKLAHQYFYIPQPHNFCFISLPLHLPLVKISISDCNPQKNILTHHHSIHIQQTLTHLYDIIIPLSKFYWLWTQYHQTLPTLPILEPYTQSFTTELV